MALSSLLRRSVSVSGTALVIAAMGAGFLWLLLAALLRLGGAALPGRLICPVFPAGLLSFPALAGGLLTLGGALPFCLL